MRRGLALAGLAMFLLGACLPTGAGSATPVPATPGPSVGADATAGVAPGPSLPSQTDTDWGRIWDALPPWFPIPVGAGPTETGDGPSTADLALPAGSTAPAAAEFFRAAFQAAGFTTIDVDGPLEDGSVVVFVPGACQIEVKIAPLGSGVVARILYGAGCPWE